MANNITLNASLSVSGTGIAITGQSNPSAFAQAGSNVLEETVTLSTTTSTVPIGGIVSMGYLFIKNLDATNNVRIGLTSPVSAGNAFAELKPGEGFVLPTRQTTIYAIAVAATPQILITAAEL